MTIHTGWRHPAPRHETGAVALAAGYAIMWSVLLGSALVMAGV